MQANRKISGSLDTHGFLEQSRQHLGLSSATAAPYATPALAYLLLAGSLCAFAGSGLVRTSGAESGLSLEHAPATLNSIKE